MPGLQVSIINGPELKAALKKMADAAPNAIKAGIYQVNLAIMNNAVQRAPKRTGVLRGSGYVALPEGDGAGAHCVLGFGGPADAYARVQHDRLDFHHTEGEAQFLTKAIDDAMPRAGDILMDTVARMLKGGPPPPGGNLPNNPNEGPTPAAGHTARANSRGGVPPRRKASRSAGGGAGSAVRRRKKSRGSRRG